MGTPAVGKRPRMYRAHPAYHVAEDPGDRCIGPGAWPTWRKQADMRELIGQVLGWLRLVRIWSGAAGVHRRGSREPGVALQPQIIAAPKVVSDWPVDVAAGRMRRWLRRESMPPPVEGERTTVERGAYFPPKEWEQPGTSSRPRVTNSGPCEAMR